ncbi:hypothetical protein [Geodermatophilus sp. CPCC 206100]|uniref:hypothetical protein n=1 Tax=Geodermatophilus sp. CPCC 206100 TaxID=3020054 RepID=UPI003B00478B
MAQDADGELPLLAAFRQVGLTARQVWLSYLAIGGNADEVSVDAQVHGLLDLAPGEYNVLAHALNEELAELPDGGRAGRVAHRQVAAGDPRGSGR